MLYDEELDTTLLREKRFRMVETQIRLRSIHDKRVLESMKRVPRHLFVSDEHKEVAYGDHPVPVGYGKNLDQPFLIGVMMQALDLRPQHRVLEVGTGCGYHASLLAEVASEVYTVSRHAKLHQVACSRFKEYQCHNVRPTTAKKTIGWSTHAPYDRILVNGALPCIPKELVKQLGPRGVLVTVVGKGNQEIIKFVKTGDDYARLKIAEVCNVPLISNHKVTPLT